MRFAIFTHVVHSEEAGVYSAYSPYVREMNLWLRNIEEVEVVAPVSKIHIGEFSKDISYRHSNLTFTSVPSFDLLNFQSSIKALFRIPIIFLQSVGAMRRADHLHLRCPGNIGLIACFAQIFFPDKPKTVKYAGNWDPEAEQPWSYKLQRWILSNTFLTRNMKVLVYGQWPDQTENVLPFFTASFSESEIEKTEKDSIPPFKFLFVGNLVPGKQPLFAVQLIKALRDKKIIAELHVYGDGEMMSAIKDQINNKDYIHLHGNQPLEILKQAYKDSHFLILASKSEGWPKAVAEAMFFGCIPIVTAVSCVPWMLNYGSRGILIPDVRVERGLLDIFQKSRQFECFPDSPEGERGNLSRTGFSETLEVTESGNVIDDTVVKIIELINNPEEMRRMSIEAQEWSQQYTLERFEEAIKEILTPQPPKGEQKRGV